MTDFRFIPITPHPFLGPYIAKIWIFESCGRLPGHERKLIVPNANLKLTLSYRNGIAACIGGRDFLQRENGLTLTGLIDAPVTLDAHEDTSTGTLIIEFNPLGAYRIFRLSYAEVTNQIVGMTDLFGVIAEELQSQLAEASALDIKLNILQNFLIKRLLSSATDPIYDYCIDRISNARGLINISQLEKETGYSVRWLQRKFSEHLGTGPKNLAEIIRFKQFYQAYSSGATSQKLKQLIYQYYHDQSHFLRAFKRFTGTTPGELQGSMNELSIRNYTS